MPRATTCIDCGAICAKSPCANCKGEDFYQSPAWAELKKAAAEEWGKRCLIPGCKTPTYRVTFHHMEPREDGGEDTVANLRPLCLNCHNAFEGDTRAGKTTAITEAVDSLWDLKPIF